MAMTERKKRQNERREELLKSRARIQRERTPEEKAQAGKLLNRFMTTTAVLNAMTGGYNKSGTGRNN